MQLGFGAGALWGERIDATGDGIGPQQFGILQGVTIDFDFTMKELYGQFQFPQAIARGQGKITGKANFARMLGSLYNDLFWGGTPATGQVKVAELEAGTIPATPTYTVTVSNSANFRADAGVFNAATGAPFKRVTTASNAGEYSVNQSTGVYTFAAADASKAVLINYSYNNASAGKKLTISNNYAGFTPTFKALFTQPVSPNLPGAGTGNSLPLTLELNACVSTKMSLPSRVDDWQLSEIDFSAFADASGTVGTFSTVE